MNYDNSGLSASDVALISGSSGNRGNGGFGGFGDNSAVWLIIMFVLFAILGFGNNGFGGFGGGGNGGGGGNTTTFIPYGIGGFGGFGSGSTDTFASLQRQLDQGFTNLNTDINQVNNNVTQGFYNTNTNLLTGFGNTNLATCQGFADTQRQICQSTDSINANINNNGYETRILGVNMASQMQQCCCDMRERVADLKYTVATENCADRQALNEGIRDVIASNTANTQAILDKLCQQEIDAKNEVIANLRTQLNMADLRASQTAQTADIVNSTYERLRDCPIDSTPIYGRQPIFTCPNNNNYNSCGCGCGNNF